MVRYFAIRLSLFVLLIALPASAWIERRRIVQNNFGGTLSSPDCLRGNGYHTPVATPCLPDFDMLRPVGASYSCRLDVPTQDYLTGMPGVTDRIEWFAIDYEGDFWVTEAGDDRVRLYIDSKLIIDNARQHETMAYDGRAKLTTGQHHIRISYFRGPRFAVALVLSVAPPGEKMRIFDMRDSRIADRSTDDRENAVKQEFDLPDLDERPILRHVPVGYKAYEVPALNALTVEPQPHAFDYSCAAYGFCARDEIVQYSIVFEIPGRSTTIGAAPGAHRRRLLVALLGLIKHENSQVDAKVSLDFHPEFAEERQEGVLANSLVHSQTVQLPPGTNTLETAAVSVLGNKASTVVWPLMIPATEGLRLSHAVLVERVDTVRGDAKPDHPLVFEGKRVVPKINPMLETTAKPSVYFVVFPDPARAENQHLIVEILKEGKPIVHLEADLPPPDSTGAIPMLVSAAAIPGRFQFRIVVRQGDSTAEQSVSYVILSTLGSSHIRDSAISPTGSPTLGAPERRPLFARQTQHDGFVRMTQALGARS